MSSIKNALREEFNDEIKGLNQLQLGTDEYKTTVDGVTKLADRIIEMEKVENERINKDADAELKVQQLNDENKDRKHRNGIEVGKVILGLGFAAWAFVASTNFEREGTLTTQGGRKALDQLLKFVRI